MPLMYLTRQDEKTEKEKQIQQEKISNFNSNIGFSPENSVIKGFIKDSETDDAIADANIYLRGREGGWEFFENFL